MDENNMTNETEDTTDVSSSSENTTESSKNTANTSSSSESSTNSTENAENASSSESSTNSTENAATPIVSAFEMDNNNSSPAATSYYIPAGTTSASNTSAGSGSYPSFEATDPNPEISRGFGIASLVMGILSIVTCCCGVGALFSILGIIFGCIQQRDEYGQKPGQAIAGIITSCIGLLFNGLCIVYLFLVGLNF